MTGTLGRGLIGHPRRAALCVAVVGGFLLGAMDEAAGQSTKMPSTLRYGSGYIDVPDATVLPHLAIIATYSGFLVSVDSVALTNPGGGVVGFGDGYSDWRQDLALAMGLFDRVELGATFQNFSDAGEGGTQAGAFGRVAILRPAHEGLGLAVGARYLSKPSFDGDQGRSYMPSRLGFPDSRLYEDYGEGSSPGAGGHGAVNTSFTPYAMATLMLKGPDASWMLPFDFTVAAGWGDGMFRSGRDLDWYAAGHSNGWVFGSAVHLQLSDRSILNLMADYNGFDANVGAQLDWRGVRLGAYILGVNYMETVTEYRSSKFGLSVSVAVCGITSCIPELMEVPIPDTLRMPAPPPDTVIVDSGGATAVPEGTPRDLCLSTGRSEQVWITAAGDTLVGPERVPVSRLDVLVFEGTYAEEARWFRAGDDIPYEGATYRKSGDFLRLDCAAIMRVGEHMGVRLFADSDANKPYGRIYVPVRPDAWQSYWIGPGGGGDR
jgi:hypothetical protein